MQSETRSQPEHQHCGTQQMASVLTAGTDPGEGGGRGGREDLSKPPEGPPADPYPQIRMTQTLLCTMLKWLKIKDKKVLKAAREKDTSLTWEQREGPADFPKGMGGRS